MEDRLLQLLKHQSAEAKRKDLSHGRDERHSDLSARGPEVLKLESRPIPSLKAGEALIRVKAFGLNRSELFTHQGHSPNAAFPRILGIEAVGLVEDAPRMDRKLEAVTA
jgi:hypothetical protein